MTVEKNLLLGAYLKRTKKLSARGLMKCTSFPQAERKGPPRKSGTLSGGERTMLAIARALIGNPKLLLMMNRPWVLLRYWLMKYLNILRI